MVPTDVRGSRARGIGGHHLPNQGRSDEWLTPPWIFDHLDLAFDLDPASPLTPPHWIPSRRFLSRLDDGLTTPWQGRIWLNPPYGQNIAHWMQRMAEHGNGIALVFARTETRWFQEYGTQADVICFIAGRLTFIPGEGQAVPGNSGGPSVLLAYGVECAQAVIDCALGTVVRMPKVRQSCLFHDERSV